jgi:hypothetical protein
MKAFSRLMLMIVVALFLAGWAAAEELSTPLVGAQLMTSPEGTVRVVLPCSAPVLTGHLSLGDAWLALPGLPLSMTRDLRVQVRAISGPWTPGGEIPVHEDLVGRLDLAAGAPARGIDMTNVVRGVLSGAELHGLLVTVPEGTTHLIAFVGAMAGSKGPLFLDDVALRDARRALKAQAPHDPTWLAYSLYAHPNARVVFHKPGL